MGKVRNELYVVSFVRIRFPVAGAIEMCQKSTARDMASGILQKIREFRGPDRDRETETR